MNKIILATALLCSSAVQADPVLDLVEKIMVEHSYRSDVVMVIFEAKGNVNTALTHLKTAMHTYDPDSLINPYWIVNFPGEEVSKKTNCGVIIGQWYTNGYPYRASWEQIMNQALQKNAQSGAYYYSPGRGMEPDEKYHQSEAFKKISKICLGGKFNAQKIPNVGDTKGTGEEKAARIDTQPVDTAKFAYGQAPAISAIQQEPVAKQRQVGLDDMQIPTGLAHKVLVGTWKGSACSNKARVEINITEGRANGSWLNVKGILRSFAQSGQSNVPVIETSVAGGFYLDGGFLALKSSAKLPDPLTKGQMEEENSRRKKAIDERKALETEYVNYLMKRQGNEAELAKARVQQSFILENERQKAWQKHWDSRQPIPPKFLVKMDIARDANGQGWVGVIEGDGFEECHDIVLASDTGATTSILPPITANRALQRALFQYYPSTIARLYWLKVGIKQRRDENSFDIARVYEKLGQHSPENFPLALQYYLDAANKTGDARAQSALGRMYSEGVGATKNSAEAQKWQRLASITTRAAAEMCASKKTIAAIGSIMKDEHQKLKTMEMFGAMITGIHSDTGNIRLVKVSADNVISLDKPFVCNVVGKRIDPTVDASGIPDFIYGGTDVNRVDYYYDNRLDKVAKTAIASIVENIAKHFPYIDSFRMEPLGNRSYNLTPVNRSRQYSVAIDFH